MPTMQWADHLMMVPIVLPMLAGALMMFVDESRRRFKLLLSVISVFGLLLTACTLLYLADGNAEQYWTGSIGVYLAANWPVPFGIALAVDRLTATMLLLTSLLAIASLFSSAVRWDRIGVNFYALFQFLLMGLNGAFLTADLFNLFVFFEVMLAASYGLVLHGSGPARVRAGLHYIAINLLASSLFLVGVSLLYAVTGTLNMADMANKVALVADGDRMLLEAGAAILGMAFLIKAGMWPLNFWLPPTYGAAITPITAIFAMMTKVGFYVLLRLWMAFFGDNAGDSLGFGQGWLLVGGLATLMFGAIGMFGSQDIKRMAGFSIIVSSGTLLTAIGFGHSAVIAAALFYMASSTLAVAAFYLLGELMERDRVAGADILALTMESFEVQGSLHEAEREEVGVAIPAALAFLGLSFMVCTLLLTGVPPLSGFLAKFAMLSALLNLNSGSLQSVTGSSWIYSDASVWTTMAVVIVSGLMGLIALVRMGVRAFWASNRPEPRLGVIEVLPIALLLTLCLAMTIQAGTVMRFFESTAIALNQKVGYAERVLSEPQIPSPVKGDK